MPTSTTTSAGSPGIEKDWVTVLTCNLNQANFAKMDPRERRERSFIHTGEVNRLLSEGHVDLAIFQEVARIKGALGFSVPEGFWCRFHPTVSSADHYHPTKFPCPNLTCEQGLVMAWNKNVCHTDFWRGGSIHQGDDLDDRLVRLERGLFTGERTTEPRGYLVAPFVFGDGDQAQHVFLVNTHLTTIRGERNGKLEADLHGDEIRSEQIRVLLKGIVSQVNEARGAALGAPPYWIVGGDFNCKPTSAGIRQMLDAGFVDMNANKGNGTKRPGDGAATHTLDYIFAGIVGHPADCNALVADANSNPEPIEVSATDHLAVLAHIAFRPQSA